MFNAVIDLAVCCFLSVFKVVALQQKIPRSIYISLSVFGGIISECPITSTINRGTLFN